MILKIRKKCGFSVMEILIVIILLSVLVVFALPNMRVSQDNARQRNALNQLRMIHTAAFAYRAREGEFPTAYPLSGGGVDCIQELNATLGTNIVLDDDTTIKCAFNNDSDLRDPMLILETSTWSLYLWETPLEGPLEMYSNPSCVYPVGYPGNKECRLVSVYGSTAIP